VGVIYAHQLDVTIGQCVLDLELLATAGEPRDFAPLTKEARERLSPSPTDLA
jgi:hypothetical protein